jgi:para-nitrobenzyl esterase
MRSKGRNEILVALSQGTQQVAARPGTVYWMPIVDGLEIPDQPRYLFESGAFNHVPTIVGTNRDEGWGAFVTRSYPAGPDPLQYESWMLDEFGFDAPRILAMYPPPSAPSATEQMARLAGDVQFVCEARRLARLIERTKTPTYLYSYDYVINSLAANHVIHGVESNILFSNDYSPPAFAANHPLDASDRALHADMAGYWTRFARTGNPNTDDEDVVHWPAFKHPTGRGRGSDQHLVLDLDVRAGMRLQEQQCDFLEPFFFRSILAGVPASAP